MRVAVILVLGVGCITCMTATQAHAEVLFEDQFTDADGTIVTDHIPNVGNPWTANAPWPINNNRLVMDSSVYNPGTVILPELFDGDGNPISRDENGDPLEVPIGFGGFATLSLPPALAFDIPPASSGEVMEITAKLYDLGANSTPFQNEWGLPEFDGLKAFDVDGNETFIVGTSGSAVDTTGDGVNDAQRIDTGEIRFFGAGNETYLPAFGDPFSKTGTGTYFYGAYQQGGTNCCDPDLPTPMPPGSPINSGVPVPAAGSGEGHVTRARVRSLAGHGLEHIIDVSSDDGATYSRIGRFITGFEQAAGGFDGENPGFYLGVHLLIRGNHVLSSDNPPNEAEMEVDFFKIETVPIPTITGDMDWDGDTDFDDIDDFVGALNDPAGYNSTYWHPASEHGDTDGDGDLDFDDITGFVDILSGGGAQSVPEPSSLLLAGLGVLGFGIWSWQRRS